MTIKWRSDLLARSKGEWKFFGSYLGGFHPLFLLWMLQRPLGHKNLSFFLFLSHKVQSNRVGRCWAWWGWGEKRVGNQFCSPTFWYPGQGWHIVECETPMPLSQWSQPGSAWQSSACVSGHHDWLSKIGTRHTPQFSCFLVDRMPWKNCTPMITESFQTIVPSASFLVYLDPILQ